MSEPQQQPSSEPNNENENPGIVEGDDVEQAPPQQQPETAAASDSGMLVQAELVNENNDNNNNNTKDEVVAVAEPAPKWPWWNALATVTVFVLIAVVVIVTVVMLKNNRGTSEDNNNNDENENNMMETLQLGNTIIGSAPYDRFGAPIALSADATVLAIGARQNDNTGVDSGMVRVVTTTTTATTGEQNGVNAGSGGPVWRQLGNAMHGEAPGDEFAYSGMAMSADATRIAVGAVNHNVTTTIINTNSSNNNQTTVVLPNAGNVRVFELVGGGTTWTQIGDSLPGLAAHDMFGRAVAMSASGEIIAAAAYQSSENGENSAHIRVFRQATENDVTTWTQMGSTILGRAAFDRLGRSMDMSADGYRIAAGATQFKKEEGGAGYVQVFDFNGSDWNQVGQDVWGDNDQDVFGRDVSLSSDGSILAAGANLADNNGKSSGLARVYELIIDGGVATWVQLGQTLLGILEDDGFGLSLSLSSDGRRLAVGASQKKGGTGYVRILDYDASLDEWVPLLLQGDEDFLVGEMELDKFGTDVQLSDDGQVLAVGSIGSDINGDESGQVQVFNLTKLQAN